MRRTISFIVLLQTMTMMHFNVLAQSTTSSTCHEIQVPTYYHTTVSMQAPDGLSCTAEDLSDIGAFIDVEYDKVVETADDLGAIELSTHVCQQASDLPANCCSRDLQSCFVDSWCDEAGDNCENHCNGFWISPADRVSCNARWTSCSEDSECCGHAICATWPDGWRGCELAEHTPEPVVVPEGCCSFNARDCYDDEWCNYSPDNCINGCEGYFIGEGYNKLCAATWEDCTSDSDCCGQSEYGVGCQDYGTWNGCNQYGVTRMLEEEEQHVPVQHAERPESRPSEHGQRLDFLRRMERSERPDTYVDEHVERPRVRPPAEHTESNEVDEAQNHRKLDWWWDWDGDGMCKYCDPDDDDDDNGGGRRLNGQHVTREEMRRWMQTTTFAEIAANAETDLGIYLTAGVNEHFGLMSSSCLHGSQVTIRVTITQLTTEPMGGAC
uniref:LNR domain-containing protein n=1 Tax=Grammatophora oceanica TaxID=210454 RepID=A0A7S1UQB1_9STRA|mmetsp:Transcript_17296/g.25597  ORF Transcript_17296/g.25597 Transcript_17296/m.25597 type:complete len:438 (+) Transcript_17296:135-1448(+)